MNESIKITKLTDLFLVRYMLTVLVDEHSDRYSAHVEPVQKILNILIGDWILIKNLFVFNHTLGHGGDDIIVPVSDVDQGIDKPVCIRKRF